MSGVYSLNQPGQRIGHYDKDPSKKFYPDVDGNWPSGIPGTPGERVYERPPGYWDGGPGSVPPVEWDDVQEADMSHSGTDTNGFIDSQTGRVLTDLPPNSSHFILGPLVDGYTYNHGYDDFTRIGYLQKDTRQFVLLAQIPGYWQSGVSGVDTRFDTNRQWDGSSITIYNSNFTLEMAEWFRDRYNESKYVKNVSYFYSGGYPQSSNPDPNAPAGSRAGAVAGVGNGEDANSNAALPHGSGTSNGDPNIGTHQNQPNHGGPEDAKIYNPQDPRNKFPKTVDPKDPSTWPPEERAAMSAEELANLGLNLLNIGLDIAAVIGLIFPEPGTSAAGALRLATRFGARAGSRALNSARNRALRGALNPLGQRAVRSGAAGRQRIPVYTGRSGFGPMRNAPGKTVFASPNRGVAGSYARSNQALKGAGSTPQGGTVYRGTLPQRYVDKYGSRNVFGQRQIKMSKSAADKAFKKATGLKEWIQFLIENEAAPTATPTTYYDAQLGSDNTVKDFKTSFRNTSSGLEEITPEQEEKVNQTADQLADSVDLPEEDLGNLAVETEEVAVQEEIKQLTPQELVNEWEKVVYQLSDLNMTIEELRPYMNGVYSTAEKISILNHSSVELQEQFLSALGFTDMGLLRNYTDESYRTLVNHPTFGYVIFPGGTPTTGWNGKFYSWGDPELERSRIVSQEEYQAAKLRPDFIGLETPDIAEPGYRYEVKPPTWIGGQPYYEYGGVDSEYYKSINKSVDDARRILGTGRLGGKYGLGLNWEYSLYKGEIDSILTGYAGAAFDAVAIATDYLKHIIKNNLVSDIIANRVYERQRYGYGESNQLTDETWNVYDFSWNKVAESMDWVFSLSSDSILSPKEKYAQTSGGKTTYPRYAADKNRADALWKEWESVREFGLSLKSVNWKDYESDEWFGEGEKSKRHPLLGPDPEPEPIEPPKPLPEVEIGGDSEGLTIRELTIDDFEKVADFSAFKNGGGNAKLRQGYTLEQVIEYGKKNIEGYDGGDPVPPTVPVQFDTEALMKELGAEFPAISGAVDVITTNKEIAGLLGIVGAIGAIGAGKLVAVTSAIGGLSYTIAATTAPEVSGGRMYQVQLLTKLTGSIVSGNSAEVKIGPQGVDDMISNINPEGFGAALQFGSAPTPDEENAIRPTPGMKRDDVFGGQWGDIGGVELHVDPETKNVTVTSNKMLRTGQSGDKFENALVSDGVVLSPGTQTKFGDIPVLSPDQIQQGLDRFNLRKPLENLFKTVQQVDKRPGDRMNAFANIASLLIDMAANGTASNAVQLRRFFTDRGAQKSKMELDNAGYGHVYSQTTIPYNKLPIEIRQIIDAKSLQTGELTSTDAATAAYERKKREEEERLRGQKEQFSPSKPEVLSESRKRILREIKQPYKLPEQGKQKYKMNFKGKFRPQNTPDVTASKQTESMLKAKNAAGQTWRAQDKHWSRYESTERMNVIYDNVGHGSQYFDMIVNENQGKKGWRNREVQEQLNLIAHEKAMRQMDSNYESPFGNEIVEQETMQYDNDPLFKKVANRLKKEIDYPNKPSKAGYPDNPPPSENELVNGQHPEHGQRHPYYTKLDPHSADAMPPTDNPKIDAEVSKAKKLKRILGKAPAKANPPKGS